MFFLVGVLASLPPETQREFVDLLRDRQRGALGRDFIISCDFDIAPLDARRFHGYFELKREYVEPLPDTVPEDRPARGSRDFALLAERQGPVLDVPAKARAPPRTGRAQPPRPSFPGAGIFFRPRHIGEGGMCESVNGPLTGLKERG